VTVEDHRIVNGYTYDGEGRLCAVAVPQYTGGVILTQYIYDAEGTRVAKGTNTNLNAGCDTSGTTFTLTNTYIIGSSGEQLTETDGSGNWLHTNVYAVGKLLATYSYTDSTHTATDTYFALSDWLGTKRAVVSAGGCGTGYVSLPYGDSLTPSSLPGFTQCPDATENHFTGKERDAESGKDYFGKRYYASSMGRWMSPDRVTLTDERILNPANTLNLYTYGANNPLKYVDPDGQDITYFYDQGGIAGHAILFAYNQATGDSAVESFGPGVHAPVWKGESNFDMDNYKSADDLRSGPDGLAALTIQTSPETTQEVINYIRTNPDPALWWATGPNCSTQCDKILQKFKLDYQKSLVRRNLTPKFLWHNLMSRYNPGQKNETPQIGRDYGQPESGLNMFDLLWDSINPDNFQVSTRQHDNLPCGGAGDPPCPK
jgi:RHS repeat-associated protein